MLDLDALHGVLSRKKINKSPSPVEGRGKKKSGMNINVFELVPDNDRPRKDCYDCLGCPHLIAVNVNSLHYAYIECDIGNEDILEL